MLWHHRCACDPRYRWILLDLLLMAGFYTVSLLSDRLVRWRRVLHSVRSLRYSRRSHTVQIRWHKRMALSGYHLLPGEAACGPCDVQCCAAGWDSTEIFLCVPALVCSTSTVCCRVTIYAII